MKTTKFRSGLEQRWADSMSAAGITWEYEPVKFGRGHTYTPDFRLAGLPVYLECKGYNSSMNAGVDMVVAAGAALIAVFGYPGKTTRVTVMLPTAYGPILRRMDSFSAALDETVDWMTAVG